MSVYPNKPFRRPGSFESPTKKQRIEIVLKTGEIICKSLIRESPNGKKRFFIYSKFPKLDNNPCIILLFEHSEDYAALKPGDRFNLTVGEDWESQKVNDNGLVTFKVSPYHKITKVDAGGESAKADTAAITMDVPMVDVAMIQQFAHSGDYSNIKLTLVEILKPDQAEISGKMLPRQSYRFADSHGSILVHFLAGDAKLLQAAKQGDMVLFYLLKFYKFSGNLFLSFTYESSFVMLADEKFESIKDELISGDSGTKTVENVTISGFKAFEYYFRCNGCNDGKMFVSESNTKIIKCTNPRCKMSTAITNAKCGLVAKSDMLITMKDKSTRWVTCFNRGLFSLLKDDASAGDSEGAAEFIIGKGDNMESSLEDLIGSVVTLKIIEDKNILECVIRK